MVFTREKNDTSNQNRERCFFTCEKNDTSNQKPQRCVSFTPKFPPFIAACSTALQDPRNRIDIKRELDPQEALLSFLHNMTIRQPQNYFFFLKGSDTWGKSPLPPPSLPPYKMIAKGPYDHSPSSYRMITMRTPTGEATLFVVTSKATRTHSKVALVHI